MAGNLEMSDPVNPFESHDLKSRFGQELDPGVGGKGTVKYRGGERRHHCRRNQADRRTDIRFEIDKEDRRKDHGRRIDDGVDVTL